MSFSASKPNEALAKVIEGAKAEGEAVVRIHPAVDNKELARLSSEIEKTFGVKLKLTQNYVGSPPAEMSKLYMEYKTGVTPHLDIMWGSTSQPFAPEYQAITQEIDWHALLDNDLTRDIDPISIKDTWPAPTLSWGDSTNDVVYRTDKLSFDEVPDTYAGFADPKFRGKIGIAEYSSQPPLHAFFSGNKDAVFSGFKAALKNDPIIGRYGDLMARLELGEIWVAQTVSHRVGLARSHGAPVGYKFMYNTAALDAYSSIVVKNCAHPNAATLVILYLSSPKGAKWSEETWYAGNAHYPGNWLYKSVEQLKASGGKVKDLSSMQEYVDYMNSDERKKMQDEVNAILVGGK
ncbi:ABC transporter substrate-binding protein [Thermodesulfobacteriota bacterium]